MRESNIKQSGFRALSNEEIIKVGGGFSGSTNNPDGEGPGFFDIPGIIIDSLIDFLIASSDEQKINAQAIDAPIGKLGIDSDGNKFILTKDGQTFTDTDGNGFYDTISKQGENGTIYKTTDGQNWVRQYWISIGAVTPNNLN